jgi:hypothetical protein
LWGIFPNKFTVYPDLLRISGYFVGWEGKAWAPGNVEASGRTLNPGGKKFDSFELFLAANTAKLPWHYWISYKDPHRSYIDRSGKASGIDINKIKEELAFRLTKYLRETKDPRETGGKIIWDQAKYFKDKDKIPHLSEEAIQKVGLKQEYSYL